MLPARSLLLILLSCLLLHCHGFAVYSSTRTSTRSSLHGMVMKKGRRIPIQLRGQFLQQQKMMQQREEMNKFRSKDLPTFVILARVSDGSPWMPVGQLVGDQRARALVNAYSSGFLTDLYKKQLDRGIAKSIFAQEEKFLENLKENYRMFRKGIPETLEFGYRIDYEPLAKKMGSPTVNKVDRSMEKDWLDKLKDGFANIFQSGSEEEDEEDDKEKAAANQVKPKP